MGPTPTLSHTFTFGPKTVHDEPVPRRVPPHLTLHPSHAGLSLDLTYSEGLLLVTCPSWISQVVLSRQLTGFIHKTVAAGFSKTCVFVMALFVVSGLSGEQQLVSMEVFVPGSS
jgi:hypothetical protein